MGEERLLYVAHGEAIIGFDLKKLKEDDITVDGERVVLRLPPVKVLHAFLDVEESRVYDYQKPIVCPSHLGDMIEASQVHAKERIEAAADSEDLRGMAETYGRTFLQLLLFQLGFEEVDVIFAAPEIEGIATPLTPGIVEDAFDLSAPFIVGGQVVERLQGLAMQPFALHDQPLFKRGAVQGKARHKLSPIQLSGFLQLVHTRPAGLQVAVPVCVAGSDQALEFDHIQPIDLP